MLRTFRKMNSSVFELSSTHPWKPFSIHLLPIAWWCSKVGQRKTLPLTATFTSLLVTRAHIKCRGCRSNLGLVAVESAIRVPDRNVICETGEQAFAAAVDKTLPNFTYRLSFLSDPTGWMPLRASCSVPLSRSRDHY